MTHLEGDVRFLKGYALVSSVLLVAAVFGRPLLAQAGRQKFTELDVERINIVEADGRIALAIANTQRLPGIMLEGKELPKELSQGREGSAGMIFFDARGTEVGGLIYNVNVKPDGSYSANRSLTLDQHDQDQVVGLQYSDNGQTRASGLSVWDRSTKITLKDLLTGVTTPVDRQAIEARYRALMKERGETNGGARRVFLGSQDQTATLRIMDVQGRDRVRMLVDPKGAARIEFVDEAGKVTRTLP